MIVGVTGLINSGKSTWCQHLVSLGAVHFDSDAVAKQIIKDEHIVVGDGFFVDPAEYARVTQLVWPRVVQQAQLWCQRHMGTLRLIESAVLLQSDLHLLCDAFVQVSADRAHRLAWSQLSATAIDERECHQRLTPAQQAHSAHVIANSPTTNLAQAAQAWYAAHMKKPHVGVIMGSSSDLRVMQAACDVLDEFRIEYECTVVSAHRTPERMVEYAQMAESRGLRVIIAGAGGAAHLPGMVASLTPLPVVGVPVLSSNSIAGIDSLLSIVQMPGGVPVATVGVDNAKNAALLAVRMLGVVDVKIREQLHAYAQKQKDKVAQQIKEMETNA